MLGVVAQPAKRPALELVCSCGIEFEPLPWSSPDLDQPICDDCADGCRYHPCHDPFVLPTGGR